jgi:hypothetical protein
MKIIKTAVFGFLAVVSVAFVAACNNNSGTGAGASPSASPSPSKALTATEQFTSAAALLRGTPYKFSVKGADNSSYEGNDDPLAGVATGKLVASAQGLTVTVDGQLSEKDYFVKLSGVPLPGLDATKWFHIDPTKLTSSGAIAFGGPTDPTGLKNLVKTVATADNSGDKQIKGTFDFTKGTWGPVNAATVTGLGAKAKSVPFEATVDDKGRLATLKVTVPAFGSQKEEVINATYSDFGTDVKVTPPATADVIEAPAAVYTLLNAAA